MVNNKIIEALLYVQGDQGLSVEQMKEVFNLNNENEAYTLLQDFQKYFNSLSRGIEVHEFNKVFKFLTAPLAKEAISNLVSVTKKQTLSQAAVEVAGIIAFKQPITRSMINNIRGVISDHIVITLLAKGLIEEVGVASTPGQPILYGITNKFYDYFKIKSLSELPIFEEFDKYEEDEQKVEAERYDLFNSQRRDDEDAIVQDWEYND
ncbi:SMC-Scp complex subunit ScpB [Mycoplasma sp. 128]|uniref:SMC-Scp complex subunit ScpB n=1 Tax=Mycoplasma sp. 3341 TaxID=3447506 RepID=UPI003F657E76